MRRSRFSESLIVAILGGAEATAATVGAVCHGHDICENTFMAGVQELWQHGGHRGPRPREPEAEKACLKCMLADSGFRLGTG